MEVKEIAKPINKVKDAFLKWLQEGESDNIDIYYGHGDGIPNKWDYYCHISGFKDDKYFTIYFTIWKGNQRIEYSDGNNIYNNLTIEELTDMITYKVD